MQSGEFDRKIFIQQRVVTKDTDGGDLITWVKFLTLFAKYRSINSKERYTSAQIRESKEVTFTIRYRSGITPDMRILYANEYYRIVGLAEVGRMKYIQISAEMLTGMGEAI